MQRTITRVEQASPPLPKLKRVAAYARVSSAKDAMLHSLSAQVSYYSGFIQQNPKWLFAGVYSDEGITGTKEARPGFQQMLDDCRAGKIDMVLTKSISRFARNTLTLLDTVRELKGLGVDVYFEEQNIHSISGDGELMLTILASFAQEESRSVSENCKWRIRERYRRGEIVSLRYLYGYRINKNGISVNKKEAAVVRSIYDDYLNGKGYSAIARRLREENVPTMKGGEWTVCRVSEILANEKYAGNALLQKEFIADHLTKKKLPNKGSLPMYFAEGTHDAIISPETFEKAQEIREQKVQSAKAHLPTERYAFSGMIRCPKCGKNYRRRICRGKASWNCSTFLSYGKTACFGKQIPEEILLSLTAEVMGTDSFDEEAFKQQVEELIVPEPNTVIYVFKDGRHISAEWQDRSRRESWTEEMRRTAAEHARERWKDI
jgi:site-specific DNA recombinase